MLRVLLCMLFLPLLFDVAVAQVNNPQEMEKWFPDDYQVLTFSKPESLVVKISDTATLFTDPSASSIIEDVLNLGPRESLWLETPESQAWEDKVRALGPRPFKQFEKDRLFEWDQNYKALGDKPKMQENREEFNKWNLGFLRIMQKYGILNQPGAYTGDDEYTVNYLYPYFLEVLKLRMLEWNGYSVEQIFVFKVDSPSGWSREVYFLLKRK